METINCKSCGSAMQNGLCPICDQRPSDQPEPLTVELQFRSSISTQPRIRVELGRPQADAKPRPAAVAVLASVCVLLFAAAILAFRNPDLRRAPVTTPGAVQARVQSCVDAYNALRAVSNTVTQSRTSSACETALDSLETALIAQQSPDDQRSLQLNTVNVRTALLLAYARANDTERAKGKAREILEDLKTLKASDFPAAKIPTATRNIEDARILAQAIIDSKPIPTPTR